jgi:predicted DNA-binding protein (UPF0251 family)
MVVAHSGSVDEHGHITLTPGTVVMSGEAAPADDTEDAELSPDELEATAAQTCERYRQERTTLSLSFRS